jgi:solute carrier family 25 folate transporter 32
MFLDQTPNAAAIAALQGRPSGSAAVPTSSLPHYRGLLSGILQLYRDEGVGGLYRGFVPGLFGVAHGALQFMAYEELKKAVRARRRSHSRSPQAGVASAAGAQAAGTASDAPFSAGETIAIAALSKSFASFLTYPYQVMRSRMQGVVYSSASAGGGGAAAAARASGYISLTECAQRTWQQEGLRGFYRGLPINIFKVTPAACIVFLVYEQTNAALKRHRRAR